MIPRIRAKKYFEIARQYPEENTDRFTVRLYTWNTALSAAFYGPLQSLEITLRNAINERMMANFGRTWYDKGGEIGLDKYSIEKIETAKKYWERKKSGESYTIDDIIVELSFGFWTGLFINDDQETLWRSTLCEAFPNGKSDNNFDADGMRRRLKMIHALRNRIAHHEPILDWDLEKCLTNILDVLGWICSDDRAWVEKYNRVHDVIKMRPPNDTNLRF